MSHVILSSSPQKAQSQSNTEKKGRGKEINKGAGFSGLAESEVEKRMSFSQ